MTTQKLPSAFGSFAALLVAFVSFLSQVNPVICVMRSMAAFLVFAAFGVIIRYLLQDAASAEGTAAKGLETPNNTEVGPGAIAPGTPISDLIDPDEAESANATAA